MASGTRDPSATKNMASERPKASEQFKTSDYEAKKQYKATFNFTEGLPPLDSTILEWIDKNTETRLSDCGMTEVAKEDWRFRIDESGALEIPKRLIALLGEISEASTYGPPPMLPQLPVFIDTDRTEPPRALRPFEASTIFEYFPKDTLHPNLAAWMDRAELKRKMAIEQGRKYFYQWKEALKLYGRAETIVIESDARSKRLREENRAKDLEIKKLRQELALRRVYTDAITKRVKDNEIRVFDMQNTMLDEQDRLAHDKAEIEVRHDQVQELANTTQQILDKVQAALPNDPRLYESVQALLKQLELARPLREVEDPRTECWNGPWATGSKALAIADHVKWSEQHIAERFKEECSILEDGAYDLCYIKDFDHKWEQASRTVLRRGGATVPTVLEDYTKAQRKAIIERDAKAKYNGIAR